MSAQVPPFRGCATKFSQPLSPKDEEDAQALYDIVNRVNCDELKLSNIVYRSGEGEKDVLRQVFRWDLAPYDHVFQNGFQALRRRGVSDRHYYDMCSYVNDCRGRPLDSRKPSGSAFISTTVSNSWYPPIPPDQTVEVYRYEIYAPGGIWTSLTLGDRNQRKYKRLDEVAFVEGIAPQYIRSAQHFTLSGYSDGTTYVERADNMLLINGNFNPQSHPLRFLNIEHPVTYYSEDKVPLVQRIRNKSPTSNPHILAWYSKDVANLDVYLTACLRSSKHNEAYYILQNWSTLLNYDPGGTHDFIVDGPKLMSRMFRSLEYTPFGEHGIDGALQHDGDDAVIFCGNLCALVDYAPKTDNNKILKGPMTIPEMFPFFKGTVFENGIDAACTLKSIELVKHEAYVFKGNLCAHINYGPNAPKIIATGQIGQIIPLLKGTIFEGLGVTSSYASHAKDEVAYFFKYNNYGQINVNVEDGVHRLEGVWVMGANAPVIHSFVPQKNGGLDMRDDAGPLPNANNYDYDEL